VLVRQASVQTVQRHRTLPFLIAAGDWSADSHLNIECVSFGSFRPEALVAMNSVAIQPPANSSIEPLKDSKFSTITLLTREFAAAPDLAQHAWRGDVSSSRAYA
jgi:hypothetical protein